MDTAQWGTHPQKWAVVKEIAPLKTLYSCSKQWMDGWMDGWMNGWMDGCLGGWMDEWMGGNLACYLLTAQPIPQQKTLSARLQL